MAERPKFSELSIDEQLDIVNKTQNKAKDYDVEVEYTVHGDHPPKRAIMSNITAANDAAACRIAFSDFGFFVTKHQIYPISMRIKGVHLIGDLRDYL